MRAGIRRTVEDDQKATRSLHRQLGENLTKLDAQEANLLDLAADGVIPKEAIRKRISAITKQRVLVSSRLEQVEQKLGAVLDYVEAAASLLERAGDLYGAAPDEIRRALNQALFARIFVYADEVTGVKFNEPFGALLGADQLFQQQSTPAESGGASTSNESRDILNIALGDVSSNRNMVGLVEMYSRKSADAGHFRKLAALEPSRRTRGPRVLPQQARRLTASELVEFKAQYLAGVPITSLASAFGIHRSTVINIASRLNLSRSRKVLSDEEIKVATVFYTNGDTLAMVAARFSVGTETMRSALIAAGIRIRARGRPRR